MDKGFEEFILSSSLPAFQNVRSVMDVQADSACGDNENFVGQVLRVKCVQELKDGQRKAISIIVKKQPLPGDLFSDMYHRFKIFNAEINMYENVLYQMEKLIHTCKEPSWNYWPEYYGHSDKDIFLQDLSVEGYKPYQKAKPLDLTEAIFVLSCLGKFHGLSLSLVEQGLYDPSNLPPNIFVQDVAALRELELNTCNCLAEAIEADYGPEWQKYPQKIKDLGLNIGKMGYQLWHKTRGKFDVINHGDCWINNILFKYDSSGRLVNIKFVDYQACHYNCYSWDIMQVLYSAVLPKLRYSNIDLLLSTYLENLTIASRKSGYTGVLPNKQEIEIELDRLTPYALIRTFITFPFFLNPEATGSEKPPPEPEESFDPSIYKSNYVKDIIKETLTYFNKKNLF